MNQLPLKTSKTVPLAIITVVFLAIAVGLIVYFVFPQKSVAPVVNNTTNSNLNTNTTAGTSALKTYENKDEGYTFVISNGWYLHTNVWLPSENMPKVPPTATEGYALGVQFSVHKRLLTDYRSDVSTQEDFIATIDDGPDDVIEQGWVTRNGLRMYHAIVPAGEATGNVENYYYFTGDDVYILFHYPYDPETLYSQDFEEMVNSFAILPDTSNWLTYENKQWGFSFKYPEGWSIVHDRLWKRTNLEKTSPNDNLYIGLDNGTGEDSFPRIILLVNTDGFGPLVPDARYYIKRSNSGFIVDGVEEYTTSENWEPGFYEILSVEQDGEFMIFFDTKDDDHISWQATVKAMLSTFQFSK